MNVLSGKIKGIIYGLGSLILLLLLFESLIYLWKQKLVTREQNLAAEVAKEMTISFERELSSLIYLNSGLEAYLKLHQHHIDSLEVQELLRHLHAQSIGHIRNLAVARGTRIAWIYPVEGNEAALGHDYRDVPDQWPSVQKGIESGEIVMDGPLELIQGGTALIFRKPVFFDSLYWGMLSTVIDVDSLMQSTFGHIPSRNFNEAVVVVRPGQVDCLYGDPAILEKANSHRFNMRVYGSEWLYVLEPAAAVQHGAFLRLLIWAGRLLMVLLSVGAGYFFIVRSRSIELGKQYRLFFEVVEQSPVSIMITRLDGSIDYVNPACQLITGYKAQELLGHHPSMLRSKENPVPDDEELWQSIQKGGKWQGVFHNQKKDGSLFWERAIVFPMLNRRGEAIKYIAIKEDITEKIESEEQLRKLNADKDRFISILAHDLRSPFNGLLGMLGLLDNEPEQYTAEQQKEMLDNINRSALSIFNLLNDLLAWSKAQAGQLTPNPQSIDLCDSIHEVLALFESLAASKQIELRLIAPDNCRAHADQYFVQTVLRNLLANALKFTPKNGTVKVEMLRMPDNIVLRVSDNGIGIDTNKIKLLWDQSLNYSTRGTDGEAGTGMGLQLCREMVSSWGGEIGVDSVQGQGSTFYFTIPNETAHS